MRKCDSDVRVLKSDNTYEAYFQGENSPFMKVNVLKKKENGMIRIEIVADQKRIGAYQDSALENMTGMVDGERHIVTIALKHIVRCLFCEGKGVYVKFNVDNADQDSASLFQFLKAAGFVVSDNKVERVFFLTRPV